MPSAVELGSFDTAVVDNASASVVTSRILVVVSEKIPARFGDVVAIHSAMPGASA